MNLLEQKFTDNTKGDKLGPSTGGDKLGPMPTPTPTAGQPTPTPTPTAGGGFTNTTLTGDDLKAGKVVKHGMKGDIVGKIQQLLIDKGFKNVSMGKTPDSIFGNRTRRMVKAFQALNNLVDDGVVGKLTWNKLNDTSAISAGDSTSADPNKPMEIPGADGVVYESLRKKILRKHLLSFK